VSIEKAYNQTADLIDDPAQRRIVALLDDLQRRLEDESSAKRSWLSRLLVSDTPAAPIPGLYLWGGVGRGKTWLMDLFFATLDVAHKRRYHFHRLMGEVHAQLAELDGVEDPLNEVASSLAEKARVLCFDEFFVSDIADAMLLGRLLDGLFARGVTLVATSNSPPHELYKGGLQRQRFLPAIELLEGHTRVVELDGERDHRLRLLEAAGTFVSAGRADAHDVLRNVFRRVASGDAQAGRVIELLGRPITTVRAARGVAWFTFAELCGGPRSARDYVELSRLYHTLIVSAVPVLDAQAENEARRFIALVDELYDRRVKLVLSAQANVDELYRGNKLQFEFERTRSRLVEMQSKAYLAAAHMP